MFDSPTLYLIVHERHSDYGGNRIIGYRWSERSAQEIADSLNQKVVPSIEFTVHEVEYKE